MKRITNLWMIAAILAMVLGLASCSEKDDPAVSPEESQVEGLADVTVMIYGSGGGNLDKSMVNKFRRLYDADPASFERVKVTVQFKFSQPERMSDWFDDESREAFYATIEREGEAYVEETVGPRSYMRWMGAKGNATMRYVVDPKLTLYRQSIGSWLADDNMDITHPDSLASFIRWSAQQCPAKQYVLVLADHGRGFLPHEEADPNEVVITRALVEDMGHNRRHFTARTLHQGIQKSGIPITTLYLDLCQMNTLEYQFEMKDLCDYIVASTYTTFGVNFYDDLVDYSVLLGTQGHYLWGRFTKRTADEFNIPTIWSYEADGTLYEYNVKDPVFNYEDDLFTYTPEFAAESKWAGTLASVYETTVFDKTVGWSRWIRLNRQEPSLWSKNDFDDELDDDDE